MAIQVGMPLETFWYEDERLLECYIKAYYEKVEYESWCQGKYVMIAQSLSLNNAFSKGKGKDYIMYSSPFKEVKNKVTVEKDDNSFLSQFY